MSFDTNNFNNVFDSMDDDEQAFDNIFGAEEDDSLMESVIGFNESGEANSLPDDDELHLNDDESNDLGDFLGPNNDTSNQPTKPHGGDISEEDIDIISGDDSSEAGDFYNDEDDNYQNSSDSASGADPDDLEGSIEDSIDESGYDFDDEDQLIDTVEKNDKDGSNVSLNYEPDDEELIDLVDGSN